MFISLDKLITTHNLKINGIMHLGAHNCEERKIYHDCGFSDEKVIWIEAQVDKCNRIRNIDNRIKIYHAVITDRDDQDVNFIVTNNGESSSIFELQDHKKLYTDVVEVGRVNLKSKTIDTFFKENKEDMKNYNFLNMDIQGAELLALKGAKGYLQHVKYIYTEISKIPLYKDGVLLPQLDEFLCAQGFVRIDTYIIPDGGWGDAFYIRSNIPLPIYIIHAPILTERKTYLLHQFDKYGMSAYSFLSKNIKDNMNNIKVNTYFKDDSKERTRRARVTSNNLSTFNKPASSVIATTMEHIEGWQDMLQKEQKCALFLEDDALFCENFDEIFNIYYNALPKDMDIALLHDGCGQHMKRVEEKLWYLIPKHFMRTCCSYIITASAAKKLLSSILPFYLPIDWEMNYHNTQHKLNVYWAEPNIIREGSELPGVYRSSTKEEKSNARTFRQVIFCNTAHLGDIFLAKEFIRWIMKNIKAKLYIISHHYNESLLRDLDASFVKDFHNIGEKSWFVHKSPDESSIQDMSSSGNGNDLYVNCWIASNGRSFYNKETGLGISPMMKMFSYNLNYFCGIELKGEVKEFIPNIDYKQYPATKNIDVYLATRKGRKAVLLINNLVLSGQAYNVNLNNVHRRLIDKYKNIDFYLSNRVFEDEVKEKENAIYFDTLVPGCNLIELTYLASQCVYIIGKGSGPFTYCLCRPVLDSPAKLISFTIKYDYDATGGLEKVYPKDKFICYRDQEDPETYFAIIDQHLAALGN